VKSHWVEHKGKRIFIADYSDFGGDHKGLQHEVDAAVDLISQQPDKSVLVLADFEGTETTVANLDVMRRLIARANHAVIRRALLGVSGSRRFFITTFANVTGHTSVMAFDSKEKALDWLVSE
jgi:hypothetical protein